MMNETPSARPDRPTVAQAARWICLHPDLLDSTVEEILKAEAWWVAARARKYTVGPTIWADGSPSNRELGAWDVPGLQGPAP